MINAAWALRGVMIDVENLLKCMENFCGAAGKPSCDQTFTDLLDVACQNATKKTDEIKAADAHFGASKVGIAIAKEAALAVLPKRVQRSWNFRKLILPDSSSR